MILENRGEQFSVTFDGKDFKIPVGKFEVADKLGNHILFVGKKWNIDLVLVERKTVDEIKPEIKEEKEVVPAESLVAGSDEDSSIPEEEISEEEV
jgi:hypothetical protein